MSAIHFARKTLLNPASPACFWRHPVQAARLLIAGLTNAILPFFERLLPSRHHCPVCDWRGRFFRAFLSADEVIFGCICSACGSFDRHRLLAEGVRRELDNRETEAPGILIGFSLSSALRLLLEREGAARCFRTDVDPQDVRFAPDLIMDLRRTGLADGSVDWVLCSHVLEHVSELEQCLAEMARILAPGGLGWIQVPQETGLEASLSQEIDPMRSHAHAWRFGDDFTQLISRPDWQVSQVLADELLDRSQLHLCRINPRERYWLVRKR